MSSLVCPHRLWQSTDGHAPLFFITAPDGICFEASLAAHMWRGQGAFLWLNGGITSLPVIGVSRLMLISCSRSPSMVSIKGHFRCS